MRLLQTQISNDDEWIIQVKCFEPIQPQNKQIRVEVNYIELKLQFDPEATQVLLQH